MIFNTVLMSGKKIGLGAVKNKGQAVKG